MTPDAQAVLAAARVLPAHEQLEVLQGLAQLLAQNYPPLEDVSSEFWTHRSIDDLAREQHIPAVSNVRALAMPDWPADETADDVINYVREQRSLDRGNERIAHLDVRTAAQP